MMRWIRMGLYMLLLSGAFVISTHAQENNACPQDFAGYLAPRLSVGEQARVLSGVTLNIRPQPSTAQQRVGEIRSGIMFEVLAGPRCNEGYVWWQGEYAGRRGWMAEGDLSADEYYLEPRGELVFVDDQAFIETESGFIEPLGCLRPPDDYTRVELGYAVLNRRTVAMLDQAQVIYNTNGGDLVNFRQLITQGSYNTGGVSASFGTHDGGGAVDISVRSPIDWSVMTEEIPAMIRALRTAGFAAWLRDENDQYLDWVIHIHAIAIGDEEASPVAKQQVASEFGYFNGFDGLPREDGNYFADRHGEPILCQWMVEMGFNVRPE